MENKKLTSLESFLHGYQGEDRVINSHEIAKIVEQHPLVVLKSKIPTMDYLLNGIEGGELVVVTGPTGSGKTTFLMTVTKNMVQEDIRSVWFSLEVTPRQFIKKLGEPLPLFYMPAKNTDNGVKWLIERIIEAKVKYDVQVVFIDHLHQIFSIDKMNGKNLSLELGDVVARIKQLALEYNIVIFLIAHGTDDKQRGNAEPKMTDIRDSGMIIRLADTVMGIWRIKNEGHNKNKMQEIGENDTWAKVRIWKNRREGKLGCFFLDHKNHAFIEIEKTFLTDKGTESNSNDSYDKFNNF